MQHRRKCFKIKNRMVTASSLPSLPGCPATARDEMNASSLPLPGCPPSLKKTNSTEKQCLTSCIYKTEIFSGGSQAATRTTVVNFNAEMTLAEITNPNISLAPHAFQRALVPARATSLIASGSMKCATCDREASNVCSSVTACRGTNRSANAVEKYHVLFFSERLICSCSDHRCVSEARRMRNISERKDGQGFGTKLAFRCAIEPIGRVFQMPSAECLPVSS
jgi:hypothetical protein